MKFEVNLDGTKEKELLGILNKRLDGMTSRLDARTKKRLIESVIEKAISKDSILSSTLDEMGNREFFELIKNC